MIVKWLLSYIQFIDWFFSCLDLYVIYCHLKYCSEYICGYFMSSDCVESWIRFSIETRERNVGALKLLDRLVWIKSYFSIFASIILLSSRWMVHNFVLVDHITRMKVYLNVHRDVNFILIIINYCNDAFSNNEE